MFLKSFMSIFPFFLKFYYHSELAVGDFRLELMAFCVAISTGLPINTFFCRFVFINKRPFETGFPIAQESISERTQ